MEIKQIKFINRVVEIIKKSSSIENSFRKIIFILPEVFQYPKLVMSRIKFDGKEYVSSNFKETSQIIKQPFETNQNHTGAIDIFYKKEIKVPTENPFLKSERKLLVRLSEIIVKKLNKNIEKTLIPTKPSKTIKSSEPLDKKKLLKGFRHKNNYERDIYHDLMKFKVREILLIANLYDSYTIESEGNFTEQLLGDYSKLQISSVPRVTGVNTYSEAYEKLQKKHFDLVIIIVGSDKELSLEINKNIKKEFDYLPTYLLLNNNSDISFFEKMKEKAQNIDNIFVWNGDSRIFFAMIKLLEDKINLENDTKKADARVILLVEDSAKYYSRYLPLLYESIMNQTQRIIEDVTAKDLLYKVLSLRMRPKILLTSNLEDAIKIYDSYKDYFLSLITDVEFLHNGKLDRDAGFILANYIKKSDTTKDIPVIIQSSNISNKERADAIKCSFIDKNSETLVLETVELIKNNMGFGEFYYCNKYGKKLGYSAKNMLDFEKYLHTLPEDSLIYHGTRNHFSLWLMARGEVHAAKTIAPLTIDSFKTSDQLRKYIIDIVKKNTYEKNKGKIVDYFRPEFLEESTIVSLAPGALGGKGRGIAFIHSLIYKFGIAEHFPNINIKTPYTFIIGNDEFDNFLENNNLIHKVYKDIPYKRVKELFSKAKLSESLIKKLSRILKLLKKPLAIRSSGLFEDSLMQPFAGIFKTYIIPNKNNDRAIRLLQICEAIKLVYASIFSEKSRSYINAINYKIEEEKMSVVIQEVVGNDYNGYHYPHISGVAQSYNYYPFSHIEPEDGFANIALGLGAYVVDGKKTFRFCPKYPNIQNYEVKDLYLNSQLNFLAVNLKDEKLEFSRGEEAGLKEIDIYEAEKHGTLKHLASVYDNISNTLSPGIDKSGPRVLDFANILKLDYIPLAKTISKLLEIAQEAIGAPVEIEFAVDLNKDKDYKASFYLLQIKPLIGGSENYEINTNDIDESKIILRTDKCMGNGIITDIYDIIFVCKDNFDKTKTVEISNEIAEINKQLVRENRKYILIGPGRWGTRDRWIGIPIEWSQISNAKIIVETSLKGYPLDSSSGSHFFHNVISMNVGYFSVQHYNSDNILAWEKMNKQNIINQTKYIKHIRFSKNLIVRMDGKKRIAIISC